MSKDHKSKEKLFGKYHDLVLIFFAFFLTTIVGGILGQYFQNRNWENQYHDNLLQSEKLAAEKVFSEIASLMDTRMYKMRRVYWSYEDNLSQEHVENRWVNYQEILNNWNGNLNKNLALLQRYFGDEARRIFEYKIHGRFRELGHELGKLKKIDAGHKQVMIKLKEGLDDLNNLFYVFDLKLLYAIKDENIGQFQITPLSLEN